MLKATHTGKIDLGNGIAVPCYVLDDAKHTRLLSRRGLEGAVDIGSKDHGLLRVADAVGKNTDGGNLCAQSFRQPIAFKVPSGSLAHGFNAVAVADFCQLVIGAHFDGGLSPAHEAVARRCALLQAAYARIGIVALVDEATGYQEVRDREELQTILRLYVSESLMPWTARFPDEFFRQMFRLRGWKWRPGHHGPRFAGKLVNAIVYDRMPSGVLDELRRRYPAHHNGTRQHRHHQHLTGDNGVMLLDRLVQQAIALMTVAKDWPSFARLFDRVNPPCGGQLLLGIEEDLEGQP